MSKVYMQQRKAPAKPAASQATVSAPHMPSMVSGQSQTDLGDQMLAKYQQHFLNNQNAAAESEADRIAASVSGARTPDEVKSQLGEKMGADFSNVNFHTDASARGMADTMGARAYTTGNDVYFGTGGFNASVAAHELVHTVQQGMVGSSMQTISAPTGGVQMKPGGFFSKLGHGLKKVGKGIAGAVKYPFQILKAMGESKKAKQAQAERLEDEDLMNEYFPAHRAFNFVNSQSSQTKSAQTQRAGDYLTGNGTLTQQEGQSYNEMLMSNSWGRQFLGLYREGDEANNTALNSLVTVGNADFNADMLQTGADGKTTMKDEAFDHLGTLMGPIIQKMMSYDLDSMDADHTNTMLHYNDMNELAASANSAFDLRRAMEGENKDSRYDAMLDKFGTNRDALTNRHIAIAQKLRSMNAAMGIRGGLSTGATQVDQDGIFHADTSVNPAYATAKAALDKKRKKK